MRSLSLNNTNRGTAVVHLFFDDYQGSEYTAGSASPSLLRPALDADTHANRRVGKAFWGAPVTPRVSNTASCTIYVHRVPE